MKYLYYAYAINTSAWVYLYRGPLFSVTWGDVSSLVAYLAIAALLMMRFTRSAERDERLSAEMEAARRVQTQLAPASLPVTPNFLFAVRYLAASEVGGDFYQVFPQPDGSVLIAIGDVSGKGLKAAMLGTLVVGALRTLAQENLPPSHILGRLNSQLVESSSDGFVTCLVLRISQAGSAAVANAGHLAPYLAGKELTVENGLPLGLDADSQYPESRFQLPHGVQLTLLSDGVIEARNSAGELFGFDRTQAISGQSAENIAGAAQAFGQEDDITVLTLTLSPTCAPASDH
jgi:serine phosphatase RsbU (regulator of sigma subunit)